MFYCFPKYFCPGVPAGLQHCQRPPVPAGRQSVLRRPPRAGRDPESSTEGRNSDWKVAYFTLELYLL